MKLPLIVSVIVMTGFILPQADKYKSEREQMVKTQIQNRGLNNISVLDAMRKVPRHLFVPPDYRDEAYNDYPLPIGYGQTISQPYIVAYMTQALRPGIKKKALEIGTGSGYQAAILAEICSKVYTIEIVPELAKEATARFRDLGYRNIICKYGDGYLGWPEYAPYDLIMITAAPQSIPQPLIDQLAEGGRLIVPVGAPSAVQELILVVKRNGKTEEKRLSFVRFVPFKRL